MPNRMVRDWTDSEKVNLLSAEAERLFTRLIMKADDYGGYFADSRRLLPNLFPFLLEKITENEVNKWVSECEKAGLVTVFMYENKKYLQINDFRQRLDKARAKYPFPPKVIEKEGSSESLDLSTDSRTTDTDSKAEVEVEVEVEVERKKKRNTTPKGVGEADASPSDLQEEFKLLKKDKRIVYEFIRDKKPDFIEPYVEFWNIFAAEKSLPKVSKVNTARRRKFKVRMNESGFDFVAILKKAATSEFLLTGNWFGFDWIIQNDTNFLKILEGKYDSKSSSQIAAVKKTIAPEDSAPKSQMAQLDYLWGRYCENQLIPEVISPDMYDLIVSRGFVPVGFMNNTGVILPDDKKREAVIEFFHLKSKKNESARATA